MAVYVKILGLNRGPSAVADGRTSTLRGFRVKSADTQYPGGAKGTLTIGSGNAAVKYDARYGGTYGNSIQVEHLTGGSLGVTVSYSGAAPKISVQLGGATAAQVADAVNNSPAASELVRASLPGTGASAASTAAAAPLANGTDVGPGQQIWRTVTNRSVVVVDASDPESARLLRRNAGRYISLGEA